jgi:hypothetical protein
MYGGTFAVKKATLAHNTFVNVLVHGLSQADYVI